MLKAVSGWLLLRSLRKGEIEVSHLAIWILLVVFTLLLLGFIIAVQGQSNDAVSNLCTKTGGLFGCS